MGVGIENEYESEYESEYECESESERGTGYQNAIMFHVMFGLDGKATGHTCDLFLGGVFDENLRERCRGQCV